MVQQHGRPNAGTQTQQWVCLAIDRVCTMASCARWQWTTCIKACLQSCTDGLFVVSGSHQPYAAAAGSTSCPRPHHYGPASRSICLPAQLKYTVGACSGIGTIGVAAVSVWKCIAAPAASPTIVCCRAPQECINQQQSIGRKKVPPLKSHATCCTRDVASLPASLVYTCMVAYGGVVRRYDCSMWAVYCSHKSPRKYRRNAPYSVLQAPYRFTAAKRSAVQDECIPIILLLIDSCCTL